MGCFNTSSPGKSFVATVAHEYHLKFSVWPTSLMSVNKYHSNFAISQRAFIVYDTSCRVYGPPRILHV